MLAEDRAPLRQFKPLGHVDTHSDDQAACPSKQFSGPTLDTRSWVQSWSFHVSDDGRAETDPTGILNLSFHTTPSDALQELTTITIPTLYNIDFSMLSTTDEANKARLSSESDNAYEVKVAPGKPRFAGQGVTLQRSSLRPISLL